MLNLLLQLDDFNDNNVCFYEHMQSQNIPSALLQPVLYRRLNYLHQDFTLNNIIIPLKFENVTIETYYTKFKYIFTPTPYNHALVTRLSALETTLLKKVKCTEGKIIQLNLTEQLKMGYLKVTPSSKPALSILLKIVGVWENNTNYGLNFKVVFYS